MNLLKRPVSRQRLALLILIAACLGVTGVFYYFWRAGYTSDTALGALMAKSVLERGERPIFYWRVGYQGTLEVYATALFFKLFGIGPRVLNLWQMLCFWGMLTAFFIYVRRLHDFWIAGWATLFMAWSTPWLYVFAMRTQPNYTETYLMGFGLLLLADDLLRHWYLQGGTFKSTWKRTAAFGLLFGFALYTYAQVLYFLGAISVQLLVLLLGHLPGRIRWRGCQGAVLAATTVPAIGCLGLGLFAFMTDTPEANLGFTTAPAVNAIRLGLVAGVLALLVLVMLAFPKVMRCLAPNTVVLAATFMLGWSPQIYFTWVLHGAARDRTALSGTLEMAIRRLGWGLEGMKIFFGIDVLPAISALMMLLVTVPIAVYFIHVARQTARVAQGTLSPQAVVRQGAMNYLPVVVFPLFALAHAVEDVWSARYALVLFFCFSTAFAWCLVQAWRRYGKRVRVLCVAATVVLLIHNLCHLAQRIAQDERGFSGEAAVDALRQRGIKYGYAYYWYAYAISFYTQEDIILEPISSNYCPFYGPMVAAAPRFAFLDQASTFRQNLQRLRPYLGSHVKVTEVWEKGDIAFAVLERDAPRPHG